MCRSEHARRCISTTPNQTLHPSTFHPPHKYDLTRCGIEYEYHIRSSSWDMVHGRCGGTDDAADSSVHHERKGMTVLTFPPPLGITESGVLLEGTKEQPHQAHDRHPDQNDSCVSRALGCVNGFHSKHVKGLSAQTVHRNTMQTVVTIARKPCTRHERVCRRLEDHMTQATS